jgi:hypothetical protein
MSGVEATLQVVDALEALGIPYMLVGSYASNFYGVARATQDADLVLQLGSVPLSAVMARLGSGFRLDPQMSFETVTMTTRHVINVPDSSFKIELFHLSEDDHDQERFRRRIKVSYLNREIALPTADDVIVIKLRWMRSKDAADVRNVIAVQGDRIDWGYVHSWCDRHGTRARLDDIRRTLPPE